MTLSLTLIAIVSRISLVGNLYATLDVLLIVDELLALTVRMTITAIRNGMFIECLLELDLKYLKVREPPECSL